jgi:hypothetical protein
MNVAVTGLAKETKDSVVFILVFGVRTKKYATGVEQDM